MYSDTHQIDSWTPSDLLNLEAPANLSILGNCHLVRGGITVLSGSHGVGKSRAAIDLAISGATRQPWLGHQVHDNFRTLFIQVEKGSFLLKKELSEALQPYPDIDIDRWLRLTPPSREGLDFNNEEFRNRITAMLEDFNADLIVIDSWNHLTNGGRTKDIRKVMDNILSCLPQTESHHHLPAVLILNHQKEKTTPGTRRHGRALLQDLDGKNQIGSVADCIMVMQPAGQTPDDNAFVLTCCKNNNDEQGDPTAWERIDGVLQRAGGFNMDDFLNNVLRKGKRINLKALNQVLETFNGIGRTEAVAELVEADICGASRAYEILKENPYLHVDDNGLIWHVINIKEDGMEFPPVPKNPEWREYELKRRQDIIENIKQRSEFYLKNKNCGKTTKACSGFGPGPDRGEGAGGASESIENSPSPEKCPIKREVLLPYDEFLDKLSDHIKL